jgi:3-oxocholest-4-en-26-oate---CoA ligase
MNIGLNIADVLEAVAERRRGADALVHGDRRITWDELDRRAAGLATLLTAHGARHQDKVALYLYNDPAYLETLFGCAKASLVPVNTNYRYTDDELVYLWDNADAVAVVFHGTFADGIERIRHRVPGVHTWLWIDDGTSACPTWAIDYHAAASSDTAPSDAASRSGSDLLFVYTGGTTGLPKGVMWEQDTIVRLLLSEQEPVADDTTPATLAERMERSAPGPCVVACPLMHGTGMLVALAQLLEGGAVVTMPDRHFDPVALLDTIVAERAERLAIVGDAFARPVVAALDAFPGRWDLSSLAIVGSSGVMWSEPVKQSLLAHQPGLVLLDMLGSSEALGMGTSISTGGAVTTTARFSPSELAVVVTEDGRVAGPGESGRLGVRGLTPLGYYKDPARTASTFPVIDGMRYALPGDWATVDTDGSIVLLGRGSECINSGGEKVFPEEVEEVLKTCPHVHDAVVVGIDDDRFGQVVAAVVEAVPGAELVERDVIAHARRRLAPYKAPRHVIAVDTIGRAPNGKADYRRLRQHATACVGQAG